MCFQRPQAPADATVEIQVVAAPNAVAAAPTVPAAAAAAAPNEPDNEDTVMEDTEAQLEQHASAEVRERAPCSACVVKVCRELSVPTLRLTHWCAGIRILGLNIVVPLTTWSLKTDGSLLPSPSRGLKLACTCGASTPCKASD